MGLDRSDLMDAFNASINDLQEGIDKHRCLVASILASGAGEQNLMPLLEQLPSKSRELELRDAIEDAIQTLEQSRKSFKSKQLELLRKRLTQALIGCR